MFGFIAKILGGGVIGSLIETGGNLIGKWQERKTLKAEGKIRIEQARIDMKVRKLNGDIDYNVEAQKGMQASWKDEFITVILWGFFICCFVPQLQPYIKEGLSFLRTEAPYWLEFSLVGTVVASFGLKGWKFWEFRKSLQNGNGNGS